jgi:transcriptional regulator with XRE-family HTH domain
MKGTPSEGRTISKRRKMVGLTQHSLAMDSGVNVQRITAAETGRTILTDDELLRIRKTLRQRAQKVFDSVAHV